MGKNRHPARFKKAAQPSGLFRIRQFENKKPLGWNLTADFLNMPVVGIDEELLMLRTKSFLGADRYVRGVLDALENRKLAPDKLQAPMKA